MSDSFYRAFEDRYRGSRELIQSRLMAYLPFITPLTALSAQPIALDLGCGRGEWLQLLSKHGFDAVGVDLDEGMLAACRELGLNARQADALQSLRDLPDGSLALVSAFHVVEHMPFEMVRAVAREALRVLQPGGLLIMETPNPENLVVGANSFYMDPSHERPIPPQLLSFVTEHAGFQRTKVVRLQEEPAVHDTTNITLLHVLDGVSRDYGVVAQQKATPDILQRFDAAFDAAYGVALGELASRHDREADQRATAVRHITNRLASIEDRMALTETAAAEAQARAEQLAAQLEAAHQQLHAVYTSNSWRITAPLRFVLRSLSRIHSAAREGRLKSGLKRRIVAVIRKVGGFVLSRPLLARTALRLLSLAPRLQTRLTRIVRNGPAPTPEQPLPLSPAAMRVYDELRQALNARKN